MNDAFNYENETFDTADLENINIKINPDYYLHKALLATQSALSKDNMQDGHLQYIVLVRHIETLCRASNMISKETYDNKVEEYKKTNEYNKIDDDSKKHFFVSEKKFELLSEAIFSNKTLTTPLTFNPRKSNS